MNDQDQRAGLTGGMRDFVAGSQGRAVTTAIVYSVLILALAAAGSSWLYDWARQRIVSQSSVASVADLTAFIGNAAKEDGTATLGSGAVDSGAAADDAGEQASAAVASVPAINVLLLGTDARPDESDVPRTDTMILASFDPQSESLGLLSLPRDLWLPIPGLGFSSKINTAYQLGETEGYPGGGPQLAKDTVGSFIGHPVQYYVRVNFDGFVEVVDLIGGIEVVVPQTIHDEEFPTEDYGIQTFHLDAGIQHLDGETALKYVRTRNIDDDYSRARRQQQVIRAVAEKVLRADMIPALLSKLPRLLYTMRSSIETDIPMAVMLDFANYARGASLRDIRQLVLDNNFGVETYAENGAWILLPDRTLVRNAVAEFFATESESGSAVAQSGSDWVRIEVLNGTGEPGVAARTRDLLEAQGWHVVSIGDADRSDYGRTLIINYGVPQELVDKVGTDLELRPNLSSLDGLDSSAPVDVRIVVGRDFLSAGQ